MFRKLNYKNRAGRLAVWSFLGVTYLAGFLSGWQVERLQTPPPPPPSEVLVYAQYPQEIRNLSKEVRSILRRAVDRKISVEEALKEISDIFGIAASKTNVVEQIRMILQQAVAGVISFETADEGIINIAKSLLKPVPSPVPTATIVLPSGR